MYQETTRSIRVTVEPTYLPDQSAPEESRFVWAYQVRIENLGKETVQNLFVLRFANTIFERLWNADVIDHVQVTVSETVGVEAE